MWCWFYLVHWIDEKSSMIAAVVAHTAVAFKSCELDRINTCTASPLPSFIEFERLAVFLWFRDQTKCLITVMLPAVNFAPIHSGQSCSKKVPSKLFFFFLSPPNHQNVLLERHSGERGWARRSILCLVSWHAFEVSVTLKTHQHMAQGKVRASLRVGTSSMFWRISHSGPCSVTQ